MSTPAPVIFTKMVTRKKPQQKEPLPEEIPSGKQKTAKRAKKVATPRKNTATPKKRARTPALPKSPTPRKKGSAARAEPIQLKGPEFGPPEEPPVQTDQPSLIALENAHLHALNQLSLAKMRQVHQEDGAHNQQVAAELQTSVNEASAQLVLTDAALKRKWEAEQDDEERGRLKNEFFNVRSILRTMTEGRGLAGAHVFAAERALDADQREHPENPSAALAEAYAEYSASYDLRTSMIDDFLGSKREKPLPRTRPAKKARSAAEKAAAKAAKQAAMSAEAEATADEETHARPEDQEAHNPETPPRAEDYFEHESAGSKAPSSVSKEHSSENSQEEYSQDWYLYQRGNAHRHGHRDREEYFPEHLDGTSYEEIPEQLDDVLPLFGEAAQTDAYDFFEGAPELTFPPHARVPDGWRKPRQTLSPRDK
jgi:hypothetical protein